MAKINIIGLVPPTGKRYKEGYTITVQPPKEKPEAKGPPKKPAGKPKKRDK
jgi:hypothetical protein